MTTHHYSLSFSIFMAMLALFSLKHHHLAYPLCISYVHTNFIESLFFVHLAS